MDLLHELCLRQGFFTRADARAAGWSNNAMARAVATGVWHRVRHGAYTLPELWHPLDEVGRHRIRVKAVQRSLGRRVAVSHVSAAVLHGVDVWGVDLSRVHVTRLDGGPGRLEGDVVHHEGFCVQDDLVEIDGQLVTKPERAVIEALARANGEVALVLFDSLLHKKLCTPEALMRQFGLMCRWPFTQHLHVPIRLADGRSESVGESRGRWLCRACGFPMPELQCKVFDSEGRLLGICDWWWPEHHCYGEFDGALKYGRALLPGQDPGEVVFAEKRREDLIREATGMPMIRVVWQDYQRPKVLAARFESMLFRHGSACPARDSWACRRSKEAKRKGTP